MVPSSGPIATYTNHLTRSYADYEDTRIAALLGISRPTVRSNALRGLEKLLVQWNGERVMTPEEHFARLRDDTVWNTQAHRTTTTPMTPAPRAARRGAGPLLATIGTAVVLTAVTVVTLHVTADASRPGIGAPAHPTVNTATPPAATPQASLNPTPDPSVSGHPAYLFDVNNPSDMARWTQALACYKAHGVKYVSLTAPDKHGLAAAEYGGAQNDHTSIVLGLQSETQCDSAGVSSN